MWLGWLGGDMPCFMGRRWRHFIHQVAVNRLESLRQAEIAWTLPSHSKLAERWSDLMP